jgi:hypothetical protein
MAVTAHEPFALRTKIGSSSTTSPSIRPGTATISRTMRAPSGSVAMCTTTSTQPATVGTTNRAPMFSPASSGSVHNLR